jgi:hypothetical protein
VCVNLASPQHARGQPNLLCFKVYLRFVTTRWIGSFDFNFDLVLVLLVLVQVNFFLKVLVYSVSVYGYVFIIIVVCVLPRICCCWVMIPLGFVRRGKCLGSVPSEGVLFVVSITGT